MFSELNQPDVIPITNYISIPDLQGGSIIGLAKLIGDLVVFQTKGIFRLTIPSADPLGWSLSESEPNIGCISTDSIVEYDAGVFFAADDNFYYLDSNFKATPVTNTIRDDYQAAIASSPSDTRCIVDIKYNRLFLKLGSANTVVYVLDLKKFREGKEHWSQFTTADWFLSYVADGFTVDENNIVYTFYSSSTSQLQRMVNEEGVLTSDEPYPQRKTGWISVPDLGRELYLEELIFDITQAMVFLFRCI